MALCRQWNTKRGTCGRRVAILYSGSTTVQPRRGRLQGRSASSMTLSGAPGPGSLTIFSNGSATMLAPWPCTSVGAVERDQTIGNVIRELIAREFPD
jgi:hypothetical protein